MTVLASLLDYVEACDSPGSQSQRTARKDRPILCRPLEGLAQGLPRLRETANIRPLHLALLQLDVSQRERDKALLRRGEVFGHQLECARPRCRGRRHGSYGGLLHSSIDEVAQVGGEVTLRHGCDRSVVELRCGQVRRARLCLDEDVQDLSRWGASD